jgi:hypothetical protein
VIKHRNFLVEPSRRITEIARIGQIERHTNVEEGQEGLKKVDKRPAEGGGRPREKLSG